MVIGLYGASGFGRQVMPLLREKLRSSADEEAQLVFVDDVPPADVINGHPCVAYEAFLEWPAQTRRVAITIGEPGVRRRLADKCVRDGVGFHTIRASNMLIMDEVELGEGAILCHFTTVNSNVRIGDHFHLNQYSHVSHDCVIGDFVTFAPGVRCNGNVVVEDGVTIGSGAIIRQGAPGQPLVIGQGAVVGMGAVVTKAVAPGTTVIGNPARPMGAP